MVRPRSKAPVGVRFSPAAEDARLMSDPPEKQGRRPGEMTPEELARFEGRIADLDARLGKVKAQREAEAHADLDAEMRGRGMAYGMRMAAELVAAVVVGGIIGWGLDWVLGSRPWLFLLFFLLGFVAGVVNVIRSYDRMQKDFSRRTGGNIGRSIPDDDD
jgi:ATP synthase protein I